MRPILHRLVTAAALPGLLALTSCSDLLPTDSGDPAESPGLSVAPAKKPVVLWAEGSSRSLADLQGAWSDRPDRAYLVGVDGTIVRYDRGHAEVQESGTTRSLYAVWGSGPDDVWAVGSFGAAVHFDGNRWEFRGELRDVNGSRWLLNALWGSGPSDVWAAGSNGHAQHFDGETWSHVKLPTGENIQAIWGTAADDVWAVGEEGAIVHFDGSAWRAIESGTSTRLEGVWGRSRDEVYAVGSFGTILRWDGESWAADPQSGEVTSRNLRAMWGNPAGDLFAVGWSGEIVHHDGEVWSRMDSPVGVQLEGIGGSASTHVFAVGDFGTVVRGARGRGAAGVPPSHPHRPEAPEMVWPLGNVASADADSVHAPYGPRWIGAYDFHAGVDLPAPTGTPVHAVMEGTVVQVRTWNGTSSGAGNAVLVLHSDRRATSYLHLDEIHVAEGDRLERGEVLGTVGRSGATYPHLHLGYFVDLSGNSVDERRSLNPLELLPHGDPEPITASFAEGSVELDVPLRRMTIRSVELHGSEGRRAVDYYDVVARGSTARNERVQGGIRFSADRPSAGRFRLTLEPEPADLSPDRVVVIGIRGDTLLDARRPAPDPGS